MKAKKVKMSDILIPGAKLTAFTIKDTPEFREEMKRVQQAQEKILKQKDIDMNRIKNTYITI